MAMAENWLREGIAHLMDAAIKEITDKEIAKATQTVEAALRKAVAEAIMQVETNYSVERMGHDLIIRVKMEPASGR